MRYFVQVYSILKKMMYNIYNSQYTIKDPSWFMQTVLAHLWTGQTFLHTHKSKTETAENLKGQKRPIQLSHFP